MIGILEISMVCFDHSSGMMACSNCSEWKVASIIERPLLPQAYICTRWTRSLRFPQQPQKPLRRIRDLRGVPPAVPLTVGVKRWRDDYRSALPLDVQSQHNLSREVLPQDYHMRLPGKSGKS